MRALALLLALTLGLIPLGEAPALPAEPAAAIPYLQNLYHYPELFGAGTTAPAAYTLPENARLTGGMLPHHLLASDMICGLLQLAQASHDRQPYDGILLVAPSHFPENCGSLVTTGLAGWQTHLGDIQPFVPAVEAVLQNRAIGAENNLRALEQDHGCAGLTPYLRRYLPDVPLAAVLLSNRLEPARLRAFWEEVERLAGQYNLLVLASVDCSHYQTPQEAARRDAQTTRAVLSLDYTALLGFNDRNVDSPQSVTSFLKAAQATESQVTLLGGSRSDQKLPHAPQNPIYQEGVTSYLVFAAWQPD